MNNNEYNVNAERTLSNGFHIQPKGYKLLHGAIGIVTETGEIKEALSSIRIDVVNITEEIGDILWYLSIFSREYNYSFEPEVVKTNFGYVGIDHLVEDMMIHAAILLDYYKKLCFYNRPIELDSHSNLCHTIFSMTVQACDFFNADIREVRKTNISKLRARFPDKFTEELANIRDLGKERKVLEGENGDN